MTAPSGPLRSSRTTEVAVDAVNWALKMDPDAAPSSALEMPDPGEITSLNLNLPIALFPLRTLILFSANDRYLPGMN